MRFIPLRWYRSTLLAHGLYGITPVPPDTGERALPLPQPDRPILDLPMPERWKAELTLVLVIYRDG